MAKGKKTGGRGSGVPNKITKDLRQALYDKAMPDIDKYYNLIDNIENPKDQFDAYIKILQLILPKIKEIDLGESFDLTKINVNIFDGKRL